MYSTFNNNTIYSSNDSLNESSNDSEIHSTICYICFENKQKLKLECNHSICKECLITFLKTNLANNCPWCRKNISNKEIKKLLPSESKHIFICNCKNFLNSIKDYCFIFLIIFIIIYFTTLNN